MIDVDIEKYLKAHNERTVGAIMQFLDFFDCCENMLKFLKERRARVLKEAREKSIEEAETRRRRRMAYYGAHPRDDSRDRARGRKRQPDKKLGHVPQTGLELHWIVGVCPKCSDKLLGAPIPSCEKRKTGRVFYAECNNQACPYYYEVIQHKDEEESRFYQVEGE